MEDLNFLHDTFNDQDAVAEQKLGAKILLVEDDQVLGRNIKKYLQKKFSLDIIHFPCPAQCLEYLEGETDPFCLVTDITFETGSADGLRLIDLLKERQYSFTSIVMTGFASIETAISATKRGVFHYLTKPFELEDLARLVQQALTNKLGMSLGSVLNSKFYPSVEVAETENTYSLHLEFPKEEDMFCGMIGRSEGMVSVFQRIKKVASSDSTVLVTGPSGTGKELVARAIHQLSPRFKRNLVSVNCGAIPGELLESELFGHMKGSFTGAISDRQGRFEVANHGSIFLDEIGDMPLLLQVKLLRVLQSRQIERVGGRDPIDVNVRIITATHRDLERSVQNGDFREDLFYRLNVIPIRIPALCERREDIPLLISYFLNRFVSGDGRNSLEFQDEALELLVNYDWPGNVRELENFIERLVILKGGSLIKAEDLPAKFLVHQARNNTPEQLLSLPDDGLDLKNTLSKIEDSLILQALEKTQGNKNQASKLLKMNRTTLIEKMKKKGSFNDYLSL